MSNCKSCGAEIVWEKSNNGKNIPMNKNGSCHFDTCPQAKNWRGRSKDRSYKDNVQRLETLDQQQTRLENV